jgi:hypothetical protein
VISSTGWKVFYERQPCSSVGYKERKIAPTAIEADVDHHHWFYDNVVGIHAIDIDC